MTKQRGRLLAFFLALCLGLSCLPQGLMTASAANETYGMVINSNVKLRRQAKENSAYWFVLPVG